MNRWAVFILMLALPAPAFAQEPPLLQPDAIVTLLENGELARAERELQRILAWSDDATARDLLGIALSRQGRLEEAEQQFSRATLLAPELLPPRQHLARLFLQQGRREDLRAETEIGHVHRLVRGMAAVLVADDDHRGGDTGAREDRGVVTDRRHFVKRDAERVRRKPQLRP